MKSQYSFRFERLGLGSDFASILEVERVEVRKREIGRVRGLRGRARQSFLQL
jgi:hypothetical protein